MAEAVQQREYETIYIMRPDVSRDDSVAIADRVKDIIGGAGKLTAVENWGRRRLAYDVARNKRGLYVYFKYLGAGNVVSEVERALRLQESVLKFHTVKLGIPTEVVEVKPEDVAYEHVEQLDEDPDETLAQSLGLEAQQRHHENRGEAEDSDEAAEASKEGEAGAAAEEKKTEEAAAEAPAETTEEKS